MKEEREYEEAGRLQKTGGLESGSGRKQMILRIAIVVAAVAAIVIIAKFKGTGGTVDFTPLTEESIPQQISSEVIPEYRDMERALACVADDKIYVVAMRGEKPTTGYDIAIDSMTLSSDKDGNDTLTVNVLFTRSPGGSVADSGADLPLYRGGDKSGRTAG